MAEADEEDDEEEEEEEPEEEEEDDDDDEDAEDEAGEVVEGPADELGKRALVGEPAGAGGEPTRRAATSTEPGPIPPKLKAGATPGTGVVTLRATTGPEPGCTKPV